MDHYTLKTIVIGAAAAGLFVNALTVGFIYLSVMIHRHGAQMKYLLPLLFLFIVVILTGLSLSELQTEAR